MTATAGNASATRTWAPSRFNVSVDLPGGQKAVFNTFSAALIQLETAAWRRFLTPGAVHSPAAARTDKTARLLSEKGFLVPQGVDEVDVVRVRYLSRRYSRDCLGVYLTPTLACNLRCDYCFEGLAQSLSTRKTMDRRTTDAVVRFVAGQARQVRRIELTWFGGEPLLGLDTIERVSRLLLPALDKASIGYAAHMQTNGTLVRPATAKRLKACRVGRAQVTVDIPSSEKRDRRGRDTLDQALDGACMLSDALEVVLRINISRDDEAEIQALYRALLSRGLSKKLQALYFANVRQPECGRGACSGLLGSGEYVHILARERKRADELGLPIERLYLKLQAGCMATAASSVAVGPDRLLYKCPEDLGLSDRAYGSVFDTDVELSNMIPWLTYDWFDHKECRNCPVLPQCAGGCPHQRLFQKQGAKRGEFCYWFLRSDLENRIREFAMRNSRD